MIHANGDIYEGEFLEDKANGYGNCVHVNGVIYKGYWKEDMYNGKGNEVLPGRYQLYI